jgi:hypothetical protein
VKKSLKATVHSCTLDTTETNLTPALVLTAVCLAALILAFIVRIVVKLNRNCSVSETPVDWLTRFSVAHYDPMQVLLAGDDFAFLSRQPGFDLSLYKKLRRERLRIFRQYLNRLITDYNRLHAAARLLLAETRQDQSEAMQRLIWLKFQFGLAVFRAEGNYLLCCLGFRTLGARTLVLRLEQLSQEVIALAQPA